MKFLLNWKQNGSFAEIENFINNVEQGQENEIIIFFPLPYINFANNLTLRKAKSIKIGAQNVSSFLKGAYTGETGASMLREIGVTHSLVGHSERRIFFNENEEDLVLKIKNLKSENITPVLCIGETKEARMDGTFLETLKQQSRIYLENCLIAYEPIWSIGTGLTPSVEQITEVACFIQDTLKIDMLYGGSVNETNISSIFQIPGIEGVLVGGAALSWEKVNKMMEEICL